jgi:hypothetical protein
MFVVLVAFLFETWIWGGMAAAFRWLAAQIPWARYKAGAQRAINRMPAFVSVLLFGVPVVVSEAGSAVSVVIFALGHFVTGVLLYIAMKIVLLTLVAVIYDLTHEKLMTLPWFVVLHTKFEALHEYARKLVAPYREAAVAWLREIRLAAAAQWRRLVAPFRRGRAGEVGDLDFE